jgi:hypothetical protein
MWIYTAIGAASEWIKSMQQVVQGGAWFRVLKLKTGFQRGFGNHTRTVQHVLSKFPKNQL